MRSIVLAGENFPGDGIEKNYAPCLVRYGRTDAELV
jgi:hypothetical protein